MSDSIKYRSDIDGLRAIAVLGVVLFHAGISGVPGGFVGVDVFFVISGYLITTIITKEMNNGIYSISRFYLRRAQRILPALMFILLLCQFISYYKLLPNEFVQYARQMIASLLFVSNVLFSKESGYFDVVSELKPLLHTWSLAVEEQYYIFWPIILIVYNKKPNFFKYIFFSLLACSFFWAIIYTNKNATMAFYLIQGRSWELLIGAFLAIFPNYKKNLERYKNILSIIGLSLILGSYIYLSKESKFPGINAIWPCAGAFLLIGVGEEGVINKYILSNRILVFTGLISYSLYLWHWPLLTIVRYEYLGYLPIKNALTVIFIAYFLSFLTWRFIEIPVRNFKFSIQPYSVLVKTGFFIFILISIQQFIKIKEGFPERMSDNVLQALNSAKDVNQARTNCHWSMTEVKLQDISICLTGKVNSSNRVLVWGDSHAEAIVQGVSFGSQFGNKAVLQMTKTSCPPLYWVSIIRNNHEYIECMQFNKSVIEFLKSDSSKNIDTVILSARWPVYALETGFGVSEEISNPIRYSLHYKQTNQNGVMALEEGMIKTINEILKTGKKVQIIATIPEMKYDIPTCVARMRLNNINDLNCSISHDIFLSRLDIVDDVLSKSSLLMGVKIFKPSKYLCHEYFCDISDNEGNLFYSDHNHLSGRGARWLLRNL